MAIVSSVIVRNHNRGNGTLSVHEQHTDHTGAIHEHRYYPPVRHDVNLALKNWAVKLPNFLAENEKGSIRKDVEAGNDPNLTTVVHITDNDKIEVVARTIMDSPGYKVIAGAEFIQTTPNLTLDAIFGATLRAEIKARAATIISNKAAALTDKAQRKEI